MNIDNYKILISNLPVRQQSFSTKRTTWQKAENKINWLKQLNEKLFADQPILIISRQDIFETTDLKEKIIKTIYWGYTGGMRGENFVNILTHIDLIENAFKEINQIDNPTTKDFNNLIIELKNIKGLGPSTYTKLLYFLQLSFNDNPCIILDQRIINVFANKIYAEFQQLSGIRRENVHKNYLNYLQLTNDLSKKLETKSENIEQFLFTFGNNLKFNKTEPKISNIWNGYCPESWLKGKTVRMRLNHNDFFESEETGLQICIIPRIQAVILNFRGDGKFKTTIKYADKIENGEILSPQNSDDSPFNHSTTIFKGKKEIENYITTLN